MLQTQGEVENSIVAYLKTQEQMTAYRQAAEFAQKAVDISTAQYEDGLVDFNTVISTMQSLASQQDKQASTAGNVVQKSRKKLLD